MEKTVLKLWADVTTVQEEIQRMKEEYERQGYSCKSKLNTLILELSDGCVCIYWEDGVFLQEVISAEEKK